MRPYLPGEQPAGDVVKLNTNENPYPPSPRVASAWRRLATDGLRRYPDPLALALRQALASHYACPVEQVFVGNGSDEILSLATRAFVEDQGGIGFFEPSYSLYPVLAAARSVEARPVALDHRFEPVWPSDDHAPLFFVAHPNAPTGMPVARPDLTGFCRRYRGVVVLDQAYADFADDSYDDLALSLPNVLSLRTLSKSFSLAGLRVGYAIGPEPLIQALFKIKDSYNVGTPAQALALEAIKDRDWMLRNVARIVRTRERLSSGLRELGWLVYNSAANFVWTRPDRLAAGDVLAGLRRKNIVVRHFPGPLTGEYLRITVGTDRETDCLLATLKEMAGR